MTRTSLSMSLAALSAGALLATAPLAMARGGDDGGRDDRRDDRREDVRVFGSCTNSSNVKLKLSDEDGRIETELEVDQNRNGVPWRVRIFQNGRLVRSAVGVTRAPSGSFEVRRVLANRPGTDVIRGVARNLRSGAVCRVTARW